MSKIDEINFGLLSETEIYFLEQKLTREKEKRKKTPEEYIKVIRGDDGSEGFFCKIEDFPKINAEELQIYIAQTLSQGSNMSFSLIEVTVEDYNSHCKRYEWEFSEEESNNENEI